MLYEDGILEEGVIVMCTCNMHNIYFVISIFSVSDGTTFLLKTRNPLQRTQREQQNLASCFLPVRRIIVILEFTESQQERFS